MLHWKDGQPFSDRYGDVYFSIDSGLEETRHVFLQGNRLADRFAALKAGENFCIGETGFGTGLNFLCAWRLFEQCAPSGASLDFFSVEKFPLDDDDLRAALALWPELHLRANALCERWRRRVPGWNRWNFAGGRVRLTLAATDVDEALPQLSAGCVDAWFLDGFSPARNPEMWSDAVLSNMVRASCAGATFATYTSAGWVRRGLQQAGFAVERVQGFGRKRQMMRGSLPGAKPASILPSSALVIGAGLAGCAVVHALARRGISVTLVDQAPMLASAASGNPRGILHARFGAGMVPLHRFVLAAYGHALALLDEVLPVDGVTRAECGLLQLATPATEAQRIARLATLDWPSHLLQAVDIARASELAGLQMTHGGLWFPAGGWVVPPQVCARLVQHPLVTRRLGCEVAVLERTASGWRASGNGFSIDAEQVVVCCGHQARALSQFSGFPLQSVRGQISELPATAASEAMRAVVCAEGYCTPALAGRHVAGATTTFDDEAIDVREADHAANILKLAAHMPGLNQALGRLDMARLTGRAGIRCSVPGATPLVGEVEPGLYCSLAHGTRGLLTAGIAGEVIATAMCGQLAPLPQNLLDALSPKRLRRNALDEE
ncbi:bifunctional tRNA (5-methylaminomethyl-2-thiouridine)(34)-methyltransferase MnmD/FAD-dependent 5-carboxymethylaminomethyl-2-thiouridine(34) oxidoreductase MnmC [Sideroxydans sp. CL21]|uniref:bifunctional tRNA (5-methylaminomethyl-2-thiouridine)(34)-methyltransferase MnmD/FAD-dependent 5-carboxymethylaminomethyl-2-thiouridine(34) oxidoreductase MnmC n=1 Tax=Sideroxydans sp. CL21 TaxID=2600596 RepID=UPI0012A83921|nr:bifunctional tRNA (5-methylaminomethyl-2-thiouridine)(34)-methyltransferase MnmD/FAD-dependent 5-carboxymethylaminomethyl-2-thiouridine(34) oxidoreductase MnmC [Sideroxydans sp. CL21]VVC84233.1 tRNA (5-methylaminomethyl-2-thiouridylate)-methyltransferase (EC 2.1.1.61) / FAD-dependent cmnm(5)s(2)U34 oxidoreductase [Sideroxydans sp. CL21]